MPDVVSMTGSVSMLQFAAAKGSCTVVKIIVRANIILA